MADALARTGLADDPERLAGVDVVGDAVDGVDDAVFGRKLDGEVAERQHGLRHGSPLRRIERVAQPVADEVDAEHDQHDRQARGR